MHDTDGKLITRATMSYGIALTLTYAFLTALVLWVLSKFLFPPEATYMPLTLAVGMSLGGALIEFFFPTSKKFGFWYVLGEALGTTLGLGIVCTAPVMNFIYVFAILAVFVLIGQSLRLLRLKKRGYTFADS